MYLVGGDQALAALPDLPVSSYRDLLNLAAEYQLHFGNRVAAARIQWRHGLEDPRPLLRVAVRLARDLASVLRPLKPLDRGKQVFKFGSAIALEYLLEGSFDKNLLALLPDFSTWKKCKTTRGYCFPDVGLILALESRTIPTEWEEMLESIRIGRSRADIHVETYRSYMDIVRSALAGDRSAVTAGIAQAAELYDRRRKDLSYKYFASNEGGGAFNDYMVDHRLAATIQRCRQFLPRLAVPKNVVHVWRW